MTAVPLGETPSLCVLCPPDRARVARPGGQTDWDCHERLASGLTEMVNRYAKLTAVPGMAGNEGRRAPGYASKPPLNLHAAMLRDPRTAPSELGEAHAPMNFALTWARWIRSERGQAQQGFLGLSDLSVLDHEVMYLYNSLDWITRQHWIVEFRDQLRPVLSQLRSAGGEPNPKPVGYCKHEGCGSPLFPPRHGDVNIRCAGCGCTYEPLDQIRMVTAQGAEAPAQRRCERCAHEDNQHSNDTEDRACNFRWCDCDAYVEAT